jgi:hypothetical protein
MIDQKENELRNFIRLDGVVLTEPAIYETAVVIIVGTFSHKENKKGEYINFDRFTCTFSDDKKINLIKYKEPKPGWKVSIEGTVETNVSRRKYKSRTYITGSSIVLSNEVPLIPEEEKIMKNYSDYLYQETNNEDEY